MLKQQVKRVLLVTPGAAITWFEGDVKWDPESILSTQGWSSEVVATGWQEKLHFDHVLMFVWFCWCQMVCQTNRIEGSSRAIASLTWWNSSVLRTQRLQRNILSCNACDLFLKAGQVLKHHFCDKGPGEDTQLAAFQRDTLFLEFGQRDASCAPVESVVSER